MHITNLDLNLLALFDLLMEERSVSKVANRVHLSQPSVSHALSRLRDALGDPLLVRSSKGMTPTPRALELHEPIRRHLAG